MTKTIELDITAELAAIGRLTGTALTFTRAADPLGSLPKILAVGVTAQPATVEALRVWRETRLRVEEVRAEIAAPADVDLHDPAYAQVFRDQILAEAVAERAKPILVKRLARAGRAVAGAIRRDAPAMLDELEVIFRARHEDILSADDPAVPAVIRAERQILVRELCQAHDDLMRMNTSHSNYFDHYIGPWFTAHVWTPEQYQQLVDSTGPELKLMRDPSIWHAAHRIGATLELARTLDDPRLRYLGIGETENAREFEKQRKRVARISSPFG